MTRPPDSLTPHQLVARWRGAVKVRTLANWRAAGRGPAFLKLGGRVVYLMNDVLLYESANRRAT